MTVDDWRRLKTVATLRYGSALPAESRRSGSIAVMGSNGPIGVHDVPNTAAPAVVVGRKGSFGKVNFSRDGVFAIDTTYFIDETSTRSNLRWLYYVLRSARLDDSSRDTGIPGLSRTAAHNRRIPFVELTQQENIARYLDHAELRLARAVSAKRRLVELLHERRGCLSRRIVLGTDAAGSSGRPTAIQWLGDVPGHWEVRPAKRFYREVNERSKLGEEPLISVSHLTGVTPRSSKNVTMFMAESYAGHKLCRPGDLVINTMWAWMGALGVAYDTGIVSPAYGVYRPLAGSPLQPEYADLLLRTRPYIDEYTCRSTGIRSSRLRLYPDRFLTVPIVCPPADEQREIVARVAAATRDIDAAMAATLREIDLLQEYRTRLTSDVVVGHRDVREEAELLGQVEPRELDAVLVAASENDDVADDDQE